MTVASPRDPQRRTTRQREEVLKIVTESHSHPNAEEIFQLTRQVLPSISLATVYRNLNLLVVEGKIREVRFHGGVTRYDGMLEAHEHFYCRSCGTVVDLPRSLSSSSLLKLEEHLPATIERYSLDYYGLCKRCQ